MTTTSAGRAVQCFLATLLGMVWASSAAAQIPAPTPFGSVIEVSRILTEVRVVAPNGEPVLGLGPQDFQVKIDGEPAEVETATWVPAAPNQAGGADAVVSRSGGGVTPQPEGRLLVLLFQVDRAFHPSRTSGLMRMTPQAAAFVDRLGPGDRVATLVFRSHLQLRSDFTDDLDRVAELLTPTEILEGRSQPPTASGPFLADSLDPDEARDAADLATALLLIGRALQPIQGPKSLVLFGYGLGRMSAGWQITIDDGYRRALESLAAARTSVFALDITDAEYHSLEKGLRAVADDTGGFYAKTHQFPVLAMDKLVRVISSYYELSVIPPRNLADDYRLEVRVDRRRVEVHVRQNHAPPWVP
jgi:VWFA-related protein